MYNCVKVLFGIVIVNLIMCIQMDALRIKNDCFMPDSDLMAISEFLDDNNSTIIVDWFYGNATDEKPRLKRNATRFQIYEETLESMRKALNVTKVSRCLCLDSFEKLVDEMVKNNITIRKCISKRSVVPKITTNLIINIMNKIYGSENATNTPAETHRSKRMAGLLTTAGRISAVEITAAGAATTTIKVNAKDKLNYVYNSVKSKIMDLVGVKTTTTTTTTKSPMHKLQSFRKMPIFTASSTRRETELNLRNKREVKMDNGLSINNNRSRRFTIGTILIPVAKMAGVAGTIVIAGTATSFIDAAVKEAANRRQLEELRRLSIDCTQNNYGCLQNYCWANCGPRLASGDWCVTAKKNKNNTLEVATCKTKEDCNKCWPCASTCTMEGGINNGALVTAP